MATATKRRKRAAKSKSLPTIWEIPDDLWERIKPILDEFWCQATLKLTLRQEARERRIISKCETFHRNPAGNQSRPAEPGQQPEASLAWGRATVTAKRRQRDQTLCD